MKVQQLPPSRASEELFQMASEIYRRTRDGDTLNTVDLVLVQNACNGNLTPAGELMFRELYKEICA